MTTLNVTEKKVEKIVRKTVTVRVPVDIHAKFKAIAKFSNTPMQKVLADFVENFVNDNFDANLHDINEDSDNSADTD
jgi:hypothetical protein